MRSRRSALSLLGVEVSGTWLALAVGACFVAWWLLKRNSGRPTQRAGGQQPADARATQQAASASGAACGPAKGTTNLAIESRLADGEHASWTVVVDTAALVAGNADIPVPAAAPDAIAALSRLAAKCSGLIVVHRLTAGTAEGRTAEKAAIVQWAKQTLAPHGFKRDSLLFTTTTKGVEAVARQVVPGVFFSADAKLCDFLAAHMPYVVCVGGAATSPKVTQVPSIDCLPL